MIEKENLDSYHDGYDDDELFSYDIKIWMNRMLKEFKKY